MGFYLNGPKADTLCIHAIERWKFRACAPYFRIELECRDPHHRGGDLANLEM